MAFDCLTQNVTISYFPDYQKSANIYVLCKCYYFSLSKHVSISSQNNTLSKCHHLFLVFLIKVSYYERVNLKNLKKIGICQVYLIKPHRILNQIIYICMYVYRFKGPSLFFLLRFKFWKTVQKCLCNHYICAYSPKKKQFLSSNKLGSFKKYIFF